MELRMAEPRQSEAIGNVRDMAVIFSVAQLKIDR